MNRLLFVIIIIVSACHSKNVVIEPSQTQLTEWLCDFGDHYESIRVPHTPKIEPLIVNDQWQGKLNYLKTIKIDDAQYGKTWLHFEGVMNDTKVFINQQFVTRHLGGYLPFSVDITPYITKGENNLRLEVLNTDNPIIPPGKPLQTLDFNYYGGIYRDAWLIRKNDIYITDPFIENSKEAGWLIHFDEVNKSIAKGTVQVQLRNDSEISQTLEIKTLLLDKNQSESSNNTEIRLSPGEFQIVAIPITLNKPNLWSVTDPNLYDLTITVKNIQGDILDVIDDKIGIRKIELNDEGFSLNNEKLFIRGTNRHQEYPYIGYAISNSASYRDALKIKNAGFDLVRLSHYPQDESFLDACDELGILVMNAIPGWQFYEEGEFVQNSFQDVRDMARRDRNHPSVVFWEVSLNESSMTPAYMEEANRILREELPFEDTYTAGWMDHPSYDLFIPARQHAKPPHYWNNYRDGNRPIFIAEYGDWEYYAHNAGFNQTAFADLSDEERTSRQLRGAGEQRLLQQAMNFQEAANSNRKGSSTIGHANWLMFDYNRGYADDLEASGISDIFRIPKFAYYFYKSQRPPQEIVNHPLVESGPFVKIASYWTEESPTNVRVFSNCDEVALYLNGSLIDIQKPTNTVFSDHLLHPPFIFKLEKYQPGKLKAVAFLNGTQAASDSVSTAGLVDSIRLNIDNPTLPKETNDVYFVYAELLDESGNLVTNSSNEVKFTVEGNGELIGDNPVKAEAGVATILFKGDLNNLKIDAKSNGLKKSTVIYYK